MSVRRPNTRPPHPPVIPMTIEDKARRLIASGSIDLVASIEDVVDIANVRGDHNTYRVTRSHDGTFEGCSCPAIARCSHIEAVAIKTTNRRQGRTTSMTGGNPTDENSPEIRSVGPKPQLDTATGTEPDTPHQADYTPHLVPEAAAATLVPLVEAPVTFKTLQAIANTEFVPASLRGRPEAILGAVLYGRELGLGPMESLSHVDVIDGRPSPTAELLARLIYAAGHIIEVVEATDTICRLIGSRSDGNGEFEVSYSIEDAERATVKERGEWIPLSETKRYREYPADMLWARAITRLHRRLFPDITSVNGPTPV